MKALPLVYDVANRNSTNSPANWELPRQHPISDGPSAIGREPD